MKSTSEASYKRYLIRYPREYCARYGIKRKDFEKEKRRVKYMNKEDKDERTN